MESAISSRTEGESAPDLIASFLPDFLISFTFVPYFDPISLLTALYHQDGGCMSGLRDETSLDNQKIPDADELVTIILEEDPTIVEAFGTREDMVQYVSEAIRSYWNIG